MKNMKKVVLLIMLGLMVSFSVFAQQALKGTIRSKADKQAPPDYIPYSNRSHLPAGSNCQHK